MLAYWLRTTLLQVEERHRYFCGRWIEAKFHEAIVFGFALPTQKGPLLRSVWVCHGILPELVCLSAVLAIIFEPYIAILVWNAPRYEFNFIFFPSVEFSVPQILSFMNYPRRTIIYRCQHSYGLKFKAAPHGVKSNLMQCSPPKAKHQSTRLGDLCFAFILSCPRHRSPFHGQRNY